jgi:DNA (cytosine-5)-methyltransferase 1
VTAAYYNEIDPDAVLILRQLIADGVIAPGDVDTRPIQEVKPDDLRSYQQCHFFAGGGLWSVAARLAGWPDERPLWTGSCPCQPFSHAGKGGGTDDPRHLWPDFFRLIGARRPPVVVGEQVASPAGYGWFDGVRTDLAGEAYAGRAVDIPACAVDAPHIRQRLYWVALANAEGEQRGTGFCESGAIGDRAVTANRDGRDIVLVDSPGIGRGEGQPEPVMDGWRGTAASADAQGVTQGDAFGSGLEGQPGYGDDASGRAIEDRPVTSPDGRRNMGHTDRGRARAQPGDAGQMRGLPEAQREPELGAALSRRADGRNGSWWADHEWVACHDGKARRTQPGTPLLVDGLPGRVGLWRVAGNAISPILAAEVLGALKDELDSRAAA